ncbi:hypothetical protein BaRGS_00011818 [Batillaria attramentaria]|uniref:Fibrinogen C-terminal domain-containing protein n=1 Tax=Batillaria attramentaria TaxID=370345 RepID=A0ABD0LBR0_9CAEN
MPRVVAALLMEMAAGLVVAEAKSAGRVHDTNFRLLRLCVMVVSVLLAMFVVGVKSDGGCSSTFNVWQPDQDVLRQLEHVQLSVQNLTSFCHAQAAMAEVKVQGHMTSTQNNTMRLERELMALQVSHMDGQLTTTKLAAEVSNAKRELDNTNRRLDNLELDLYMLRTRIKDVGPRYERAQMSTDMASLLKNSVGDLKAEWLLMKREIEALKRDTRRLTQQQDAMRNSTKYAQDDVKAMTLSLQVLEKRAFRSEDQLHLVESRLSKVMADLEEMKDSVLDLTAETENQRSELSTLQAGNIRLEKQLHDLQVTTNRLHDRRLASPTPGSSGHAFRGRAENSPDIVLQQSAAGEDFIARDCHELYQTGRRLSGVYHIQPKGAPYLTAKQYLLRVDLEDWEGRRYWAEYSQFTVGPASDNYRLRVSGYTGDAGDSLSLHDNMAFSTEDVDNDLHTRHCAAENQAGWWFHSCFSSNLNGVYHTAWYSPVTSNYADGVVWFTLKDSEFYSLKSVHMMLKPKTP